MASYRRASSSNISTHPPCYSCHSNVAPNDHQVECSRCKAVAHAKCVGLDGNKLNAYHKVSNVLILWCTSCREFMEGLEGRLAALESKVAAQSISAGTVPSAVAPLSPDMVADIVGKVCELLLPKLASMVDGLVRENIEVNSKRNNLVLVGLSNDVDEKLFVRDVCNKLNIVNDDVADCFRDGRGVPGSRSRIVKIRFTNMQSRRTFLTGFNGVRSGLSAASTGSRIAAKAEGEEGGW